MYQSPSKTPSTIGWAIFAVVVLCVIGALAFHGGQPKEKRFPNLAQDIRVGAAKKDVAAFIGQPDSSRESHNARGDFEIWYVGDWEIDFANDRVIELNRISP